MESNDRLILWALAHAENLKLKTNQLSWISDWFREEFEFKASFDYSGTRMSGWGASSDKKTALAKAIGEALERSLILENNFRHSAGLAVHPEQQQAKENAKNEALERHVFLSGFLGEEPVYEIELGQNIGSKKTNSLLAKASELCLRTKTFTFNKINGITVVALMIFGDQCENKFGMCLGLGASRSFGEALDQAIIEASRKASWASERDDLDPLTLQEFHQLDSHSFKDHLHLCFDEQYARAVEAHFTKLCSKIDDPACLPNCNINVDLTAVTSSLLSELGMLYAYKASSPEFILPTAGPFDDPNLLPHPIG